MGIQSISSLLVSLAFLLLASGALISILRGKESWTLAILLLAGSISLLAGSLMSWPGGFVHGPWHLYLGGLVPLAQKADSLSLFFMSLLALVGVAIAFFSPSYLEHLQGVHHGIYWFCLYVFVGSMAYVFLAPDAITFMVFWELMSLSSVLLVLSDHSSHRAKRAAVIYLGATRVSTTLLSGGFLWLHAVSNSWMFADWASIGAAAQLPLAIVFLGLCIKAGIWPFHLWLPYAHTEAPAPVSALMSGVMVKVAIYAMIRLLLIPDNNLTGLAYSAIILGAISAFWGILFAQVEGDLKRLLAYSTVENTGLIVLAMGLTLLSKSQGMTTVASIALAGCLFHILNHAVYKPLLFLSAGAIDCAAHTRDLSKLGGLQPGMPWTAVMFFFGSMAICAVPPLNGFASKWLIYQAFFQFSLTERLILDRALALGIIGLLSMVGAMSLVSFTKAFGLSFLGRPRTALAARAREVPATARTAQGLLLVCCIFLSLGAMAIVPMFAPLASTILPGYAVVNTLPEGQMVAALLLLLPLFYLALINFGGRKLKHFSTWECGYGVLPVRSLIGAASYSRPLANLFGMLIQHRSVNHIGGQDRRHFPDAISVQISQIFLIEKLLYRPILHAFGAAGKSLIRLQTGNIQVHLLYVFATLLILVLVGTQQ